MTYSDESAGIVHGLLLLNLLQEGSLDVLVGLGGGAGAKERHGGLWRIGDALKVGWGKKVGFGEIMEI